MYNWKVYVKGNSILDRRFNTKRESVSYANGLKEKGLTGHIYNLKTLKVTPF